MPKRFVGDRVFGADSSDHLFLEKNHADLLTVMYQPAAEKLSESEEYESLKQPWRARRKLLEFSRRKQLLKIYPLITIPQHPDFLKPKYDQIESIAIDNWNSPMPRSKDDVLEILSGLPSGFIRDFSYGLGLVKDYRFIISAIEQIAEVRHLLITSDGISRVSRNTYVLSYDDFEAIRKGLNRITNRQQGDAAKDKAIFAHNSLLTSVRPTNFPEQSRPYRKDTILKLIPSDGSATVRLSQGDQNAAIRLVEQNKSEIARKAPHDLMRLRNDIELASLEVLISKYEEMLGKDLTESRWQKLFNDNPFILNLAFGYPVVKIRDQAHVGGRTLSGSGETIADFLVKNKLSNNAALFEIKKPGTRLLQKTPYREELYAPSSGLAGAMSQMLDQKGEFQKDIARIKENSRIYDIESYSVHGVLVIGITPQDRHQQKSFELFRGNSKDITIITFDELLAKLKYLHEFLSSNASDTRLPSVLYSLETKVLELQRGFHELYEYTESKQGSIRMGRAKPLPGVEGQIVMRANGRLSVLKTGFEKVRLEKPPYVVGFDDSDHAIRVDTVEEFATRAQEAIADAEAVLALQIQKKQGT